METMYFVLGMLSIVAAAFVAMTVWGIVKINKLTTELKTTHKQLNDDFNQIYRRISDVERQTKFEVQEIYKQIDRHITECRSYTDSRFDKALGAPPKQLIKG